MRELTQPQQKKVKVYQVKALVTHYCACSKCCPGYGKTTSKMRKSSTTDGVAIAPKLIPYWFRIYIPGAPQPLRIADDTGGGMRRKANLDDPVIQIDVRIPDSHARALKLGKSYRDVYVILNDPNEFQCAFFESRALAFWETDLDKPEAIFAAVLTESAIFPPVAAAS